MSIVFEPTITGATGTAGFEAATNESTSDNPGQIIRNLINSAANLFGESSDKLTGELSSGTSLQNLAMQKGISVHDLVETITQSLKSVPLFAGMTDTELDATATKVAARPGGPATARYGSNAKSETSSSAFGASGSSRGRSRSSSEFDTYA